MIAGFAKAIITPSLQLPMAGYIGLRKSDGILDNLHVRCIYLKEKEEVFLFQYDLLYVDGVMVNKLIKRLQKQYSIKKHQVIVNAIHTHSGPAQILEKSGWNQRLDYIDGDYDEALVDMLVEKAIQAASEAYQTKEEAVLYFSKDHFRDIGTNRNQKDKAIDDTLSVLKIRNQSGCQAIIFSYACHPTIMHEENTKYSCDLLGPAFEMLEKQVSLAMFYNGACGDVSTRFTKNGSGIQEVKRLGALLAQHILEVMNKNEMQVNDLKISSFTYTCKARTYISQEDLQVLWNKQQRNSREKELYDLYEKMRYYCENKQLSLPVHMMQFDTICYVYVPVELFSSLALYLKSLLSNEIILVSYAMDYFSYMPDQAAYDENPIAFEAVISPFAKGCGEHFMDCIVSHIKKDHF
ncbi:MULTISPECIES: neutral/alkaline non-lysosomal ceramidase N-terminal domain-containing protein [Bacillota]|uniref:Neutral/alkaline non-lysosomal ceramidase N-terminal domain-containing protein n=2 Tax=Amedibacillus TaxID=2749846 RepID=A0A7G9GNY0_9FIRM|nr:MULTISPECIES: neutral/alkaline non-lysosomal ceramidase N-terminal domain-containing protein [Bacillota]QNM12512.1 neutral/alkaline non-lysosomal ceramidase N-terminal domain-containing protein [[Eubacterium] hominis]MCH4284179.1 neutral/alkaline non-lysosomal ceramidase N-terminal domain-containing protein [Amedibacillus hominis]RGB57567.1 hypothetical protein DW271_04475 [Absiella sp. AM22-9]RGB62326.1 hypothetical protein DW120_04455 [Absiella sp. AM10-20]RGB67729.1 hypothetical protein 